MTSSAQQALWQPTAEFIKNTNMQKLIDAVNAQHGLQLQNYADLWQFSVDHVADFWTTLWDVANIKAATRGNVAIENENDIIGARFFPQAKLNFAENLLRRRDDADAVVFWGEDQRKSRLSHAQLYDQVSQFAQALQAQGVVAGDRVAAYMPNVPQTLIAMLASSAIGATFTSASPDFGVQGLMDRFGQVEPTVLIACDGYFYNQKHVNIIEKVAAVSKQMPSLSKVIVVPYLSAAPDLTAVKHGILFDDWLQPFTPTTIDFVQLPFDHPLYILYSSGTTGVPKCIVHRAGGVLLKHASEHIFHFDIKRDDRLYYFTTCSWMMWNWLVSGLMCEATLLMYDGAPTLNNGNIQFDFADAERCTHFGTSPKFLEMAAKINASPKTTHSLATIRCIMSTGSPLVAESYDYVYQHIKSDVALVSFSGGTDLVGSFVGGVPTKAVYRGEIQAPLLGMKVEVCEANGSPASGKGELACAKPFPSRPLCFWNDEGDKRYKASYYEHFANRWYHGDFIEATENGGYLIHGRSDATLNPGGIRIGTAEIYRQVECVAEVLESVVIAQQWPPVNPNDVRIVLFVKLRDGLTLDEALISKIKNQIKDNTTPRHMPARVVQVPDVPRTKSGKIVELAVRNIIHGKAVENVEALGNPEALAAFEAARAQLQDA